MHNRVLFTWLFFLFLAAPVTAGEIVGHWLLTTVEVGGEADDPLVIMNFTQKGRILIQEWEYASWTMSGDHKAITVDAGGDDPMHGSFAIDQLDDSVLRLSRGADRFQFRRVDPDLTSRNNEASGLSGSWELVGESHASHLLNFELPDELLSINSADGVTSTERGQWIASPGEGELLIMGTRDLPSGVYRVAFMDDAEFVLESSQVKLTVRRKAAPKLERLSFEYDDFPEEPDLSAMPAVWQDVEVMAENLQNVHEVEYRKGRLVADLGVLQFTDSQVSEITTDPSRPMVNFRHFSISPSGREQFGEDYRGTLQDQDNAFFPKEEPWPYRVIGKETVQVPAGDFSCTVVEGFQGETRVKYWMIDDLPGVYARIINEGIGFFDDVEYYLYELERIER